MDARWQPRHRYVFVTTRHGGVIFASRLGMSHVSGFRVLGVVFRGFWVLGCERCRCRPRQRACVGGSAEVLPVCTKLLWQVDLPRRSTSNYKYPGGGAAPGRRAFGAAAFMIGPSHPM